MFTQKFVKGKGKKGDIYHKMQHKKKCPTKTASDRYKEYYQNLYAMNTPPEAQPAIFQCETENAAIQQLTYELDTCDGGSFRDGEGKKNSSFFL